MRGFWREFEKTFCRLPCILVLLTALVLNACLFCTRGQEDGVGANAHRQANAYLAALDEKERPVFLEEYGKSLEEGTWDEAFLFTDDLWKEQKLVQEFEKRIMQTEGYPDYLKGIQMKAKQQDISIFQDISEYTKRDLNAAAAAFAPFLGRKAEFVNSDTFLHATEFIVTDIIALAVLFYLVVSMVIYEKEHGLFSLLRASKNGRGSLICAKMAAGTAASFIITVLFWAGNFIMSVALYGMVDLSAPLQSVYGYDTSAFDATVGQFLFVFLVSKAVVYTAVSFLALLLSMKALSTMEIYLGACVLIVVSAACYAAGVYSGFYILHYANLIFLVRVVSFYRFYFNLNILGYPVSIMVFSLCCTVLLLGGCWYLNWRVFASRHFSCGIRRWPGKRKRHRAIKRVNVSVFSHECYKLFVSGRGWALLLAFLCLMVWIYGQKNYWVTKDERYYKEYMELLAGQMDKEKEAFLEKEKQELEMYEALLKEKQKDYGQNKISEAEMAAVSKLVSEKLESRDALLRVLERAEYAKRHRTPLVYETGYLELLGYGGAQYREDMANALGFVIALVLLAAPFFATEYSKGMMQLISTQYAGRRRTLLAKGAAAVAGKLLIFPGEYMQQIIQIGAVYGYAGLSYSSDTIPELAGGFLRCPLWAYLGAVYFLRFVMACATLLLVMGVAVYRKNTVQAVSLLLIFLAFPLGLHLLGMEWADLGTLNGCYSVNRVLNERNVWLLLGWAGVLAAMAGGGVRYLIKEMGGR